MESIAQPGTEFVLEDFVAALITAIEPYVEAAVEIARTLSQGATWLIKEIERHLNSFESPREKLARLTWFEVDKLGKARGLSRFDRRAGWLMFQAKHRHGHRLPEEAYLSVADCIDRAGLKPKDNFEGLARDRVAQNNRDARKAVHNFKEALRSKDFRSAAKRRLYRACDKWMTAFSSSGI
jgi:hypothetical protein